MSIGLASRSPEPLRTSMEYRTASERGSSPRRWPKVISAPRRPRARPATAENSRAATGQRRCIGAPPPERTSHSFKPPPPRQATRSSHCSNTRIPLIRGLFFGPGALRSVDIRRAFRAGVVEPDGLEVGEEVGALLGHLLFANAGGLDPAEGQLRLAAYRGLVDVDHAHFGLLHEAHHREV